VVPQLRRQGGLEPLTFGELQTPRVQPETVGKARNRSEHRRSILRIAYHRMADTVEVTSNLMPTPGFRTYVEKGGRPVPVHLAISGNRPQLLATVAIWQITSYDTLSVGASMNQRQVVFGDRLRRERAGIVGESLSVS
jgi:hypothetical protein